ncbi:glycosyltransferase family 4 protein [Actinomadura soli]|uniref:Glycosyltransferase family 4 protein n=1 Tax=Actinomadura soli TaxID=2508997 RepID=A0A5C4J101_9ACTN|nr:glycosyltransferase family 4 protein [Actinomadura soli]
MLYLAFYFPPSRASGVYRPRATANLLVERGWDVTVFAAPMPFLRDAIGSFDERLLDSVDPRVTVVRPDLDLFVWQHNLRDYTRFRRTFPHLARSVYGWKQKHVFPENYASWAWASVRRALRMHARQRFDVVLATGNPFASFAAAWLFHRMTRTPYILDNRDAWTLDLFSEEPAFEKGHPAYSWERRVLKSASDVVFVNEALRSWHAERYPRAADRMMVVPNGWDADTLDATVEPPAKIHNGRDERRPRFSYVGTLTGKQPIEAMVEGFGRAREHPDLAHASLDLHGYLGFFKGSDSTLIKRLAPPSSDEEGDAGQNGQNGLSEKNEKNEKNERAEQVLAPGVRYRGPMSKTELHEVYRNSDVLVFLAGGARYVTSGKIFEYMAAGRPIVSVHAPGSAAEEFLRDYPLWFNPSGLDPEAIARSMVEAAKAAAGLDRRQIAEARDYAARFERTVSLEPLVRRLSELAARRGAGAG